MNFSCPPECASVLTKTFPKTAGFGGREWDFSKLLFLGSASLGGFFDNC